MLEYDSSIFQVNQLIRFRRKNNIFFGTAEKRDLFTFFSFNRNVTIRELAGKFSNSEWSAQSALIDYNGDRGIVLLNAQVRHRDHGAGQFVVFWEDGEVSACPPEDFELIKMNLWR